jgi:phospholipase B1
MKGHLLLLLLSIVIINGQGEKRFVDRIEACAPLKARNGSAERATDVRIDDVKVVMSLGDSITAAAMATGLQGRPVLDPRNLVENRGLSFLMGGDPGELTIPNLMKRFNPLLIGASTGDHAVEVCHG